MTTNILVQEPTTGRPSGEALAGRLARLRATMAEAGLDTFLVSHPHNRRYLSGFTAEDAPPLDTAGLLIITTTGLSLLTDARYDIQAQAEVGDISIYTRGARRTIDHVIDRLKETGARRLGFEAHHLIYSYYEDIHAALPDVELVATRGLVDRQRTIKDAAEMALMRRAISISDQVFDEVSAQIRPGMTEKQVARMIEERMVELGAEGPAFHTIVAAGPNSAMAHAIPGDRPIGEREPIVIDMGARYHGYNSDMTRTISLGGHDAKFQEIYNLVLRSHLAAETAARSGLSGEAVDAAARDIIVAAGYGDQFGHGTGHGIGLEVHEPPRLAVASPDETLDAGVVVSIEPGVYIQDWGGVRIEDLVLLSPGGAEVLTGARKGGYLA